MTGRGARSLCSILLAGMVAGCAVNAQRYDRGLVDRELEPRTGHTTGPGRELEAPRIPEGILLDDGVTEDEAVGLALWNNAAFQETLAGMGIARADVIQAGLLSNPMLSVMFPNSAQGYETSLSLAVHEFWQRPRRIAQARLVAESVGQDLVQNGLDLIRDVRVAFADLALAYDRTALARVEQDLLERIAALSERRFEAGDISEFESMMAGVDALRAKSDASRFAHDATVLEKRLRMLLGYANSEAQFDFIPPEEPLFPGLTQQTLVDAAVESRPDLRAAGIAIEAAGKQAGLSRIEFLTLTVLLNADEVRSESSRSSAAQDIVRNAFRDSGVSTVPAPGTRDAIRNAIREARGADSARSNSWRVQPEFQVPIPLFNRNQGAIARADAELERAILHSMAVRDTIILEVQESWVRFNQAREELELLRAGILPVMEEAVRLAERAYESGAISFLQVLQTTRQVQDARIREAEAVATLGRARAELERSVGLRLDQVSDGTAPPEEDTE